MTPQFRFTFFNAALYPAGIVVNQPLGWRDAKLSLTRDPLFHSLIEYFKGTFIWYGIARDVIVAVDAAQGPGATLRVLIEQRYNVGFVSIFDGLLDISQLEDITKSGTFYKISVPIIRDDFWSKIINRKGAKADIAGAVDMDGNAIAPQSSLTLNLTPQAVRQNFIRVEAGASSQTDQQAVGVTSYLLIDNANFTLDEINKRYEYGSKVVQNNPVDALQFLYVPEYAGSYTFNMLIAYSLVWTGARNIDVKWFITTIIAGVRTNTQIGVTNSAAAATSINSFGFNPILASTITLNAGDQVYIYGVVTLSAGVADLSFIPYDGLNDVKTQFTVQADTIYQPSTADVFRIFEAFLSILEKITGQVGCLDNGSELLGCSGTYHLTPGTAVRGYSLVEKQFFASFDDLWQGADPLFNLGMGYFDAGGGVQKVEILKKEDFYDKTPAVNFDNVPNLIRTYNLDRIFRKISIGFKSWSAETGSGIDDPQTKHDYDTGFATVGKDISLISSFYAASLGIEGARRQRKEFNKDYRLDSEIMIIAYNHSDQGYPELNENFTSISNLLNAPTRYNSRLTPAENMLRWINYFNGCMQTGGSGKYFFRAGQGNIAMTSQLDGGDCDPSVSKAENGDLDVTGDFMFLPNQYKCSMPMSKAIYDNILANRKKAIGISATDSGHIPMFIMDMDYSIMFGRAEFTLLQAS